MEVPVEYQKYNLYCFSGLKGQTKVGKSGLHFFSNKVTLVMSSPSDQFLNYLLKALFKRSQLEIGRLELTPESVEREFEPELSDSVKYVCISPLVPCGPNVDADIEKEFLSPFDDSFSDFLYESTMVRMESSGLFTPEDIEKFFKFQIVPDKVYLTRMQENSKKFSRVYATDHEGYRKEVRGYTFPFTLYADPAVQKFIFHCGFGEYADKGFGMIDLANTNPIGRAENYDFEKALAGS